MGHVRSHTGCPRASARPGQRGVRGHVLQESVGQAEILVVPSLKRFQRFRNRIWGPEVPICLGFGGAQCPAMKNMAGIRGQGRRSARRACFETGQVLASPFPATDALVLLEKADASVQTRRGRICSVLSSEASGVPLLFPWWWLLPGMGPGHTLQRPGARALSLPGPIRAKLRSPKASLPPAKSTKSFPMSPLMSQTQRGNSNLTQASQEEVGPSIPLHSLGTARCGAGGLRLRTAPSRNRFHRALLPEVPSDPGEGLTASGPGRMFGENAPRLPMSSSLGGLAGESCGVLKIIRSFGRLVF